MVGDYVGEELDLAADYIDSRDIIGRIAFLRNVEDRKLDDREANELASLLSVEEDVADYATDWEYGATLIRHDAFEDYARELAEDIGAISRDASWPLNHIDWEAAANELKGDYSGVDVCGVTYYVR